MPNHDLLSVCRGLSREQILEAIEDLELTDREAEEILFDWPLWARAAQLPPPGEWRTWLIKAGRGFGKTRAGAEWVRMVKNHQPRIALVGRTSGDVRDVMVEGESGILACSPAWDRPQYEPSKRRLTWPNGAIATTYTADEPDLLRGPQHHAAWADEVAAWKHAEAWDNLMFGLRLGHDPRAVVTTTPKRVPLMKALQADPTTVVTRGSTYDNAANLAGAFLNAILRKYEGTTLGRQELMGEDIDDAPGALWRRANIDADRVPKAPEMQRIVVAVDPSASSGPDADECGIVGAGKGVDNHGHLLADESLRASPADWARKAVELYHRLGANLIVAEANNGGEMVELTIKTIDPNVPVRLVHASRSKQARAEPVAALAEQHRLHHVGGFALLEDELCSWEPGKGMPSPNRLDAYVWAMTELMLDGHEELYFA